MSPQPGHERIRVLHVITRLVRRGASRHVIDLARSLDPARFDVEILAGRGEDHEGSLWDEAAQTGLRLHYVDQLRRPVSPWQDLIALREITRIMRQGCFDIVHTHVSKAGTVGRLAAWRARVAAVVHTYHGIAPELSDGSGVKGAILRAIERRLCYHLSDACIYVTEGLRQELVRTGFSNASVGAVIPNGVDLEYLQSAHAWKRPAELEGSPSIGMIGSLTMEKGGEDLLRAAALLAGKFPGLRVYLMGKGPLRGSLQALADELGLGSHAIFPGEIIDIRPWLAATDVFVMPSHSEGMGLAAVEAMAMGVPVVASDIPGLRDVVGEAGLLSPASDPKALADALNGLLASPAERQRLGGEGRRRALRYGLAQMAELTSAVYEGLLSRRAA